MIFSYENMSRGHCTFEFVVIVNTKSTYLLNIDFSLSGHGSLQQEPQKLEQLQQEN